MAVLHKYLKGANPSRVTVVFIFEGEAGTSSRDMKLKKPFL